MRSAMLRGNFSPNNAVDSVEGIGDEAGTR